MLPVISNDSDSLSIVPRQHSNNRRLSLRLKGDTLADIELKHLLMCAHLPEKMQLFHDPIIKLDEFCLTESAYINLHSFTCLRSYK
jgi:hypothetical protein